MAVTTADLVNEFIALDAKRKALEGDVEKLKEQLAVLEPQIMQRFENAGMQSMKSTSGVTLYIRREVWAGAAEGAETLLLESLKSVGLGDMVKEKVNTQTLSAYVREVEKEQFNGAAQTPEVLVKALPPALQAAVAISERYSLRTRKG